MTDRTNRRRHDHTVDDDSTNPLDRDDVGMWNERDSSAPADESEARPDRDRGSSGDALDGDVEGNGDVAATDMTVDAEPQVATPADEDVLIADEDVASAGEPATEPWAARARRRIVARPKAWAERPWTTERIVRFTATSLILAITTIVMMSVVHMWPFGNLVLQDNTPAGGDMGAHVWAPAYLRDELLPNFQLNGWTMDWYAGFPAYRFYMVLPALAIVVLDPVLAYGVAFKLVAVSGLVLFPISCWSFGRLARFRYPLPELFAVAGVAFALDESFSIYGGNLKSTMAGEFSFSIALTLGMFGLGVLARGLETGKYKVWAAVLLAAACVSHGIVLIYVAATALVLCIVWFLVTLDRRRLIYAFVVGVTTLMLSAFWVGPFLGNHEYMTDMKYEGKPTGATESYWDLFFPLTLPLDVLVTVLAVIGVVGVALRRQINGVALAVAGLLFVAGVYMFSDGGLPLIGLLWNPRLLPYIYLVRYLLMMIGIIEVAGLIRNLVVNARAASLPGLATRTATLGAVALVVYLILAFMYQSLPGGGTVTKHGDAVYAWGPFSKTTAAKDAEGSGWARYNFTGYEGKPLYREYHDVVQTMGDLGETRGCGRAFWEHDEDNGQYGTTMALMLLPFWTDGCIGSMEGLYFESSGTTPYHFISTASMSEKSSNPVRELRYVQLDADAGIRQLEALGVRYVMLRTKAANDDVANRDDIEPVAESGPWTVYELVDHDIVEPMTVQPVVVNGRPGDQRERNLELGTSWYQNPTEWSATPADDGPAEWQRIDVDVDVARRQQDQVDVVTPTDQIRPVQLPEVEVSNVEVGEQSLSFDVDQPGVPILVKVSYFPNWAASGADGPYRIAPNMMVVVPTDTHVELDFERSGSDTLFYLATLVGLIGCVALRFRVGDRPGVEPWPPVGWVSGQTWEWGNDDFGNSTAEFSALSTPPSIPAHDQDLDGPTRDEEGDHDADSGFEDPADDHRNG